MDEQIVKLQQQLEEARLAHIRLGQELAEEREARQALERKVRELRYRVEVDSDTGLLNKCAFMDRLNREKERLEYMRHHEDTWLREHPRSHRRRLPAAEQSFTVVMIDADRLKYVNDTFGHNMGDELLKAIANAMRRAIRPDDEAARIGGDEFALLLRRAGARVAQNVCGRLLNTLSQQHLQLPGATSFEIHASVGAAVFQVGARVTIEEVVHAADGAMYGYKEKRRQHLPANVTVHEFLP